MSTRTPEHVSIRTREYPIRLAHLSDIHFGRIAHEKIVGALVEEVNGCDVDLAALSGDLTQRARHREFQKAAAMLEAFRVPTLVVPGNHDVYPWWHPVSRLMHPLGRFRRFVTDDLAPTFEREGLAVLGINSAHGRTVKGGRIDAYSRHAMQTFFADRDAATFKVLVVHHHLTQIQALGPHDVARKAKRALEAASSYGVDLILCGHLHVSHVEPIELVPEQHPVVIASAGTATSSRGRGPNRETNFYNLIHVEPDHFLIEERRYDVDTHRFVTYSTTRFERAPEEELMPEEKSMPEAGRAAEGGAQEGLEL